MNKEISLKKMVDLLNLPVKEYIECNVLKILFDNDYVIKEFKGKNVEILETYEILSSSVEYNDDGSFLLNTETDPKLFTIVLDDLSKIEDIFTKNIRIYFIGVKDENKFIFTVTEDSLIKNIYDNG